MSTPQDWIIYLLEVPKRPDWFGVVGVGKLYKGQDLRLSYVTWQEPANPFVVVELLSPGTEDEDLGTRRENAADKPPSKWEVYERILRIPYYVVFSRYTNELRAFQLVGGHYEPMNLTNGYLLMPEIDLSLGLWQGSFRDIERLWLRWFTLTGELIPAPTEEAAAATERAIIAEQEAAQAKRKAEQLAERLRQLGVNPDELDELL